MTDYPPYSGDSPRCTKCGNHGARTEYRAIGDCLHETGEQVHDFTPNPRLHRECDRCGHAWDEATVEQRLPVHGGGNAEDCPACDTRRMSYPYICPGPTGA
ncbi:hypothetical protein ACFUJR_14955 [Streptomyces sp. NPDC057271]|uniref:hypothetical protein n=1 Tax=unclassified Streptomyces TaxID=2593676 RepID=UPI0036395643